LVESGFDHTPKPSRVFTMRNGCDHTPKPLGVVTTTLEATKNGVDNPEGFEEWSTTLSRPIKMIGVVWSYRQI
jgi:hypothetical protein